MTSQQFKWIYRDTAAQDLLQLVYHAPPFVSSHALKLLRSIRSESILPNLQAIVIADDWGIWERRYALRGIASVSSSVEMPQLADYMERAFSVRCKRFRQSPYPEFYNSDLSSDLLDDLAGFVDKHISNREWFFNVLSRVEEPIVLGEYINHALNFHLSDNFKGQLFEMLLNLIDQHPEALSLAITSRFLRTEVDKAHDLLAKNLQYVAKRCLSRRRGPRELLWAVVEWPELCNELVKAKPELAVIISDFRQERDKQRIEWQSQRKQNSAVVQENAAYQFLMKLYEAAQNNDRDTYGKLRQIAKEWNEDIPLRAVATHFIGKLAPKYDSLSVLQHQMKYAHDDWGEPPCDSPIRFEAGEALSRHPSPENWECLVDAFFINPQNVLSSFIHDWIEHLTDILSGDLHDYRGGRWRIEDRGWFHELADLDEKELERYS